MLARPITGLRQRWGRRLEPPPTATIVILHSYYGPTIWLLSQCFVSNIEASAFGDPSPVAVLNSVASKATRAIPVRDPTAPLQQLPSGKLCARCRGALELRERGGAFFMNCRPVLPKSRIHQPVLT